MEHKVAKKKLQEPLNVDVRCLPQDPLLVPEQACYDLLLRQEAYQSSGLFSCAATKLLIPQDEEKIRKQRLQVWLTQI